MSRLKELREELDDPAMIACLCSGTIAERNKAWGAIMEYAPIIAAAHLCRPKNDPSVEDLVGDLYNLLLKRLTPTRLEKTRLTSLIYYYLRELQARQDGFKATMEAVKRLIETIQGLDEGRRRIEEYIGQIPATRQSVMLAIISGNGAGDRQWIRFKALLDDPQFVQLLVDLRDQLNMEQAKTLLARIKAQQQSSLEAMEAMDEALPIMESAFTDRSDEPGPGQQDSDRALEDVMLRSAGQDLFEGFARLYPKPLMECIYELHRRSKPTAELLRRIYLEDPDRFSDIIAELGITNTNARKRKQRGLEQLRQCLETKGFFDSQSLNEL